MTAVLQKQRRDMTTFYLKSSLSSFFSSQLQSLTGEEKKEKYQRSRLGLFFVVKKKADSIDVEITTTCVQYIEEMTIICDKR